MLAPTWVPDGQKLWSLTSNTQQPYAESSQLFGTATAEGVLAPGLLVEDQPASPGAGVGSGTAVTVRGHSGVTRASKDAGDAPFEGTAADFARFRGFLRLSRFILTGNHLDLRTEQKIIDVPVDRGICCHIGGG